MPSLPDPRETGLARLLGIESRPDAPQLRLMLKERAADLGAALAGEAAASDDVYDSESALAYLDLRLSLLADIVPDEAVPTIRRAFEEQTAAW